MKNPMKSSLLGETDKHVSELSMFRASSAPKEPTARPTVLLSRVDLSTKLDHIRKIRANKLVINKYSFAKKEVDSGDQQSVKPMERFLA